MKILGIDQSFAKCAFVLLDGDEFPIYQLIKTGDSKVKKKLPNVCYFDDTHDQIHYIIEKFGVILDEYQPDLVVFEDLALGAMGNQTRNLAMLLGAMVEEVMRRDIDYSKVKPTTLKSYSRSLLPEEQQIALDSMGRPIRTKQGLKKRKMEKKDMVEVVRHLWGQDYLSEYRYSGVHAGLDDISDGSLLAHYGKETQKYMLT